MHKSLKSKVTIIQPNTQISKMEIKSTGKTKKPSDSYYLTNDNKHANNQVNF